MGVSIAIKVKKLAASITRVNVSLKLSFSSSGFGFKEAAKPWVQKNVVAPLFWLKSGQHNLNKTKILSSSSCLRNGIEVDYPLPSKFHLVTLFTRHSGICKYSRFFWSVVTNYLKICLLLFILILVSHVFLRVGP